MELINKFLKFLKANEKSFNTMGIITNIDKFGIRNFRCFL